MAYTRWDQTGWFADIDSDQTGEYRWQPCLQLDGWCPPLPVWFKTEQDCLDFIRTEVISQGIYDDGEPQGRS